MTWRSQCTRPRELPILGEVGEDIKLELDRDEVDLSSFLIIVRVTILNDNAQEFLGTSYSITLNTTVFTEQAARNSEIEYTVARGDEEENDSLAYLAINLPQKVSECQPNHPSEIPIRM